MLNVELKCKTKGELTEEEEVSCLTVEEEFKLRLEHQEKKREMVGGARRGDPKCMTLKE